MNKTTRSNDIAFVSRQLAAKSQSQSLESALVELEQSLPSRYSAALSVVRQAVDPNSQQDATARRSPLGTLQALLAAAPGSREMVFAGYNDLVEQSRLVVSAYWAGLVETLGYLAIVSTIATAVVFIFLQYTIPGFGDLFDTFGAELPELTRLVFESSGLPSALVAVVLLGGVLLVTVVAQHLNRRLQQQRPSSQLVLRMPLIGKLAETHQNGLFLQFTQLLRGTGLDIKEAIRVASSVSRLPQNTAAVLSEGDASTRLKSPLREIALSVQLGTYDQELAYQCEVFHDRMTAELVSLRNQFTLFVKTALFILVGVMVIAMYLPLFKLGSVI